MSEPTAKQIAEEGLRMLEESKRTAEFLTNGLPDPRTAEGPITVTILDGPVTFYPHQRAGVWGFRPEREDDTSKDVTDAD